MLYKKALSPLVATILLVVFALVIGSITMIWGERYVRNVPPDNQSIKPGSRLECFDKSLIDNQLKDLQIEYIVGNIPLEEYLEKEKAIIQEIRSD